MNGKKRIICFGDSLTWGYIPAVGERYPEGVRWTSLLAEYTGCTVIEEGLSGRTSVFKDPLLPFGTGSDYIQACVMSHSPADLLIIMLGTNDMKTYVCNCAEASARGVATVACMALEVAPELKVLIVSPPPIGRHITQLDPSLGMMSELNQDSVDNSWKIAECLRMQAELYGFYFMDAGDYTRASAEDAVHLDKNGSRALARAIAGKVDEIFA